jgi:UPF0176 protein
MLTIAALYHFAPLPDPASLRAPLLALCRAGGVKGSLLLASEGINGTIAGPRAGIAAVLAHLRGWPGFRDLRWKESAAAEMPFGRMKVRLKAEIVTLGQPGVDPRARVGTYVAPQDWNALITAPEVAVIDTRNAYEVAIGTFAGAEDPATETFRAFPDWWQANRERLSNKRIAMFCTGGIRCEKATSWLLGQGVEGVYHLDGGILRYLAEVPEGESLWQGECFVFDERVSVGHGLRQGDHVLCRSCRRPVSAEERQDPHYEEGVSCPACHGTRDETARRALRERQRQVRLAEARGGRHLGEA